jgi:hypothetical protein
MRYLLLLPLLWCLSCKKDSPLDEKPVISFVRIYPDTVKAFTDSIMVEITYEDGDGDIGENNAYVQNLFLTDQRNQLRYGFRVGRIAAEGSPAIRGSLVVVMPYINLINAPGPESTSFTIVLSDRAGHTSNAVVSSPIVVTN